MIYLYLAIYIILLVLSINEIYGKRKVKIKIIYIIFILCFLAGTRDELGTDYQTYKHLFINLKEFSQKTFVENGFKFLIVAMNKIKIPPKGIFFTFSLITLLPLNKILLRRSIYPIYSIFLYYNTFYFTYVFNTLRQGIVMTIFLYMVVFFNSQQNKTKFRNLKVIIMTLFSIQIHKAAIFTLFLLKKSKQYFFNKKYCYICILVSTFLLFLFNESIKIIIFSFDNAYVDKYKSYILTRGGELSLTSIFFRIIIIIIIINGVYKKNEYNEYVKIYLYGFLLYLLFFLTPLFATRINMQFRILEIILLPVVISNNLKNRYYFIIVTLIYSLTFIKVWIGYL